MNIYKQYLKRALITVTMLTIYGCEKDPEQHLELGNWYLQKGLIDDAITEYREVSRLLPPDHSKLCLLYTSPSPRDRTRSRMPSSA